MWLIGQSIEAPEVRSRNREHVEGIRRSRRGGFGRIRGREAEECDSVSIGEQQQSETELAGDRH